jgi:nucleoside-diphosphate-sugar epimerase
MQPSTVLVTGSSGFIGTHLMAHLAAKGIPAYGLDVRPPDARFLQNHTTCDLLDEGALTAAIERIAPDIIVHLAARTDLDGATVDDYPANSTGVANLIKAIRGAPSVSRCLFTSSQLVCRVGYLPQHDEDYCPPNPYGASKVLTERVVRSQDGGGVTWCLFRPTTIWGRGMNAHYTSFFNRLKRGHYFHPGHQDLFKSYGFVGNTVFQIAKFISAPRDTIQGQVFFLADYEPISLPRWIDSIASGLGAKQPPRVPLGFCKGLAILGDGFRKLGCERFFPLNSFRLNNILTEYTYDMGRTQGICGELPYSYEDGIAELVAWMNGPQNEAS